MDTTPFANAISDLVTVADQLAGLRRARDMLCVPGGGWSPERAAFGELEARLRQTIAEKVRRIIRDHE